MPPGPSKNASGRWSAVKRARAASTVVSDTCHSYLGFTRSEAPTKQSRSAFAISVVGVVERGRQLGVDPDVDLDEARSDRHRSVFVIVPWADPDDAAPCGRRACAW